jgi:hypothetical protein
LEDGNVLEQVRYEMFSRRIVSRVFLAFSGGATLSVAVDPETDQVVVSDHPPGKATEDVSSASPWRGTIGRPLYAAWTLENHNGYADALQLDFRATVREEPRTIQLYGAGSTIHIAVMVETN